MMSFCLITACSAYDIDLKQAQEVIQKYPKELIILDVRTPLEFKESHLKGAVNENIDASDFETKLAKYPKDKKYLVYCATGGRGRKAVKLMKDFGFNQLYHLTGGIEKWEAQGLPLELAKGHF
jgi:rhodanese-related sulfurtransferase